MELHPKSILGRRANTRTVSDLFQAALSAQARWYYETLLMLNLFLDTDFPIQLAKDILDVLMNDINLVISALLIMEAKNTIPEEIASTNGMLASLRPAKKRFQNAFQLYGDKDLIPSGKTSKFLDELDQARENISTSLECFSEDLVNELRAKITVEYFTNIKESSDGLPPVSPAS